MAPQHIDRLRIHPIDTKSGDKRWSSAKAYETRDISMEHTGMAVISTDMALVLNRDARKQDTTKMSTKSFCPDMARQVRSFHKTMPGYGPTPLVSLEALSKYLGVHKIRVKDESYRFGLNAFKVLGASYALTSALRNKAGPKDGTLSLSLFRNPETQKRLGEITVITATDGNHGRAVAWSAHQLGCSAVVYMPKGSSPIRLENIRACGAEATIIDGNYDDAVKLAAEKAKQNGWLLLQDTAWPGYESIPGRIMQGYLTMFEEAFEQLGDDVPTHVFVQCGVGSFAASLQAYLVARFGHDRPLVAVVEPKNAACFYESIVAGDGRGHKAGGNLDTIMAGLACGEPSTLAWDILRDYADVFVACSDGPALRGMRVLGNPLAGDDRIISGESGAVTLGLLYALMRQPTLIPSKEALHLNDRSGILLFSTEGDTDPDHYREVVWGR
jgi:diaminopropionate ammonia-lyase